MDRARGRGARAGVDDARIALVDALRGRVGRIDGAALRVGRLRRGDQRQSRAEQDDGKKARRAGRFVPWHAPFLSYLALRRGFACAADAVGDSLRRPSRGPC